MTGTILYEASFVFQPSWFVPFSMLIVFSYFMVKNVKAWKTAKTASTGIYLGICAVVAVVMLGIILFAVPDQIRMYQSTVGAYKRGDYQVVEGYVENYHAETTSEQHSEGFTLDGVSFEYDTAKVCFGYHQAAGDGGVITGDGQHLRIGYTNYGWLGNVIVYLEELP